MTTLKMTRGRYLMVLLSMCGLIASTLGILTNTAGIFFGPIALELGLGDRITAVSLTLTISNLVFAFSGILAASLVNARNFRPMVAAFTAVLAGATAAMALCRSLPLLYLVSGVRGFAAGMISSVLATTVIGEWFHSDTGLISSLALGCSGLAGALFNPIFERVILAFGWRAAYGVSALVIVALNLPAMALPIALRPADAGMQPLCARAPARGDRQAALPWRTGGSQSPAVTLAVVVLISIVSFVCAMPQLFKAIAATYGLEQTGVAMMSVVLAVNTGGKLLCGALIDRMGVRRAMLIYDAVVVTGILLLLLVRASAAMLLSAALIGLCYSIPTVGAVMISRELFSPEYFCRIFPRINLGASAVNALGYTLLSAIHSATGSYVPALILSLALMLVSMGMLIGVYRVGSRE